MRTNSRMKLPRASNAIACVTNSAQCRSGLPSRCACCWRARRSPRCCCWRASCCRSRAGTRWPTCLWSLPTRRIPAMEDRQQTLGFVDDFFAITFVRMIHSIHIFTIWIDDKMLPVIMSFQKRSIFLITDFRYWFTPYSCNKGSQRGLQLENY